MISKFSQTSWPYTCHIFVDVFRDLKLAERSSTRAARATPFAMVAEATRGVEMRARKRKRDRDAHAGVAFPALPFDVAVFLVEKHLPISFREPVEPL